MHAPSTKRRPTGRRPWVPTRSRRLHRRARVASATLILAALIAGALLLPAGGAAAGGGTGSTSHGGQGGKSGNPFHGNGMWIWYVKKSSGGDLSRIARKAQRHGIETALHQELRRRRAPGASSRPASCRYLHPAVSGSAPGSSSTAPIPGAEAKRGAEAVREGADCLVIDAESSTRAATRAADTYINKLRHAIGGRLPHRARQLPLRRLPPRVPLLRLPGPGGARFNLPQVYWHAIGVSVGQADRHTIRYNRVYERGPSIRWGRPTRTPEAGRRRSRSRSSVASRSRSASPASAGGRGRTRARSSGARWAETSTASRESGAAPTTTPASPRATRATWSSGRRSTCAAPGRIWPSMAPSARRRVAP